ncbi:MAG: saccharopine dehydrogenase C-terminal domain-containing protein [Ferruginibacter sp.]
MMNVAILGAGMVGRAIAIDLSKKYNVTSFDINENNVGFLNKFPAINKQVADLLQYSAYPLLLKNFDLVVSAVPGFMGFKALEAIIHSKKNVADISFFPENALDLNTMAIENNVTAIVDCGVAPGMSNLILGYCDSMMQINSFECMVGGLPRIRTKPFEYKAPFSPVDVIEEYTRPARYVENGHIVIKEALSDPEYIDFENAGTLEAFNTDGLRSILFTMSHISNMKEKTLRYPGHIDLIKSLQMAGFFTTDPINVKGTMVRPLDLTSALLIDKWKLKDNEPEFTIMKIIIKGVKDNKQTSIEYDLFDEYDTVTESTSMSRTTGYACSAMLNLIAENFFTEKGIFPPELIGKQERCFEYIMKYLKERNVIYTKKVD